MLRPITIALARTSGAMALLSAVVAGAENGVWLDVPYIRQGKNGCGAAAVAMVMQYWQQEQGLPITADAQAIQHLLYKPEARGIYASDLERYLGGRGFRTYAISAGWQDLKDHLSKGRPLIVAVKPGRGDFHYLVIVGMDEKRGVLLKHDPAQRKLVQQRRSEFEKQWKATGNWTLLALPER